MANEQQLAILFADICGSTRLYETIGDERAREVIGQLTALMTEIAEHNGGTLIKTIGDEVMVTFAGADGAATAATQMQEAISVTDDIDGQPMMIRAGFHFGPVLREGGDVFGDAVNLAARMAGQAKAGQVLTTCACVSRLGPQWAGCHRRIDCAPVKGKRDEVEIFELLWQRDDLTRVATHKQPTARGGARERLVLEYGSRSIEVGVARTSVTIGRADQNDLVVKQNLVSRLHARIDYHKGRFVLTDQSTNGTYVIDADGEQTFVHRDMLSLHGDSLIGLGEMADAGPSNVIRAILV